MEEQRAKFRAEVSADKITITLGDDQTIVLEGDDAKKFAIKDPLTNSVIDTPTLMNGILQEREQSIFDLVGNKALSTATHYGDCTVIYKIPFGPDHFGKPVEIDGKSVSAINVDFRIRIIRRTDA